jgi:hypothetical protein
MATTTTIYLPKLYTQDTEKGIVTTLKDCIITVPKNVIDTRYFVQAVQHHILDIAVCNVSVDVKNVTQKLDEMKKDGKTMTNAYFKAQDRRNDLLKLQALLNDAIRELDEILSDEYENITEVKQAFRLDNFAKNYAVVLTGFQSRKVWKNGNEASKGKIEEIKFRFKDEDKIIPCLQEFDLSRTQEQKKAAAVRIQQLANDLFSTNGGDIYKNVSFKFTAEKVNKELYTRFKKPYSHDGKGNIKDIENLPFDLVKQLYFMCLIQLGVPTINGQKIIKVDEMTDCKQAISVKRKAKKQEKNDK